MSFVPGAAVAVAFPDGFRDERVVKAVYRDGTFCLLGAPRGQRWKSDGAVATQVARTFRYPDAGAFIELRSGE